MKVPKMYKSSDRYNAGTDVIYDDDSKLQYAPFIYATTGGDSGDGGNGDDEEGEDSMVINLVNGALDKTWNEIYEAVNAGKFAYILEKDTLTDPATLKVSCVHAVTIDDTDESSIQYIVVGEASTFNTNSDDGYPTIGMG